MPWLQRPTCLLQAADVCVSQHQQQAAPASCANLRVVVMVVRVRAAQQMAISQQFLSTPGHACLRLSARASLGRNPRQSGAESANRVFRAGGLNPGVPDYAGAPTRAKARTMGAPHNPATIRSNAGEGADPTLGKTLLHCLRRHHRCCSRPRSSSMRSAT